MDIDLIYDSNMTMGLFRFDDLKQKTKETKKTAIHCAVTPSEKAREDRLKAELRNRGVPRSYYSEKMREFIIQFHNELERELEKIKP
jgi:hypothetical protein